MIDVQKVGYAWKSGGNAVTSNVHVGIKRADCSNTRPLPERQRYLHLIGTASERFSLVDDLERNEDSGFGVI